MITQNMTDKKMTYRKIYTISSFEKRNSNTKSRKKSKIKIKPNIFLK